MSRNYFLAMSYPNQYKRQLLAKDFDPIFMPPEGRLGDMTIEHRTVPSGTTLEMLSHGGLVELVGDITIAQLFQRSETNRKLWMSNTPSEVADVKNFEAHVSGTRVLVAGLGLGILPVYLAQNGKEVTVVEISEDVIGLIRPHVCPLIRIIHADYREWIKTNSVLAYFDHVILDIWGSISADDGKDMCELFKATGLPGDVWGLGAVIADISDVGRGFDQPSDSAHAMRSQLGWEELADYIENYYDDCDYGDEYEIEEDPECDLEVWADHWDDVLPEALQDLYGVWV